MLTRFQSNIQAIILAFSGFFAFAVSDASIKWFTAYYDTLHLVGYYNIGILFFCVTFSPLLGGFKKTFHTSKLKYHLGRGVAYMFLSITIVMALSYLELSIFYTIIFLSPFVITGLAKMIFYETISLTVVSTMVAGFIGVLIVMRPGMEGFTLWMLLPFLAAFFVAALSLLAKSLGREETLLSLAFYPSLFNLAFISTPVLFLFPIPAWHHLPFIFLTGCIGSLGVILTALAYQTAKANIVAPIQYTQIIWGIMFGFLIFGDVPDIWTIVGGAIIIGAGLFLVYTQRNQITDL